MNTRRTFVMMGAAAATGAATRTAFGQDKIRHAVIGCNGRGKDHIGGFSNVADAQIVALCDVDANVLAARANDFEKRFGRRPLLFSDMRRVFDSKDIDTVSIATPNHWHSLAGIWACQAGKDAYIEKPISHNVFEGRQLAKAAGKYSRIVQHGVQLRSSEALQEAVDHLRKGTIGKVYMARGLVYRWRPSIGHKPEEPVPAGLNYDMWTGPAQMRPFSRRLVHYNWHWHWDYGNGDVGNQGIHETDMCLWGLGLTTLPSKIGAMGGKFLFDDDKETPEQLTSTYLYPKENKMVQFEVRAWCTNSEEGVGVGNIFYGSDGYMLVKGYDSYETYLGQKREKGPARKAGGDHYGNFIKAVRSRKTSDQNGPVETGHVASALAHLGNIAFRLDRQLQFDPATERFVNDKQANAMLTRNYRAPYVVPQSV
jgi:predicted dehydrogenase